MKSLLTWQEVIPHRLWTAEYVVPGFRSRTTVLKLEGKDLLVFSPGAPLVDSFRESGLGRPTFLLLPNAFHHLGAAAWKQVYPDVRIVCSAGAAGRIASKGHSGLCPLEDLRPHLPPDTELLEPGGTRGGETWLKLTHDGENVWIVCDSFFNMPRYSRRFLSRLIQKLTDAAPGLKVSTAVKYGLVKDLKAYKKWVLERIKKDAPTTLIPAHGDILRAPDLPERLTSLMHRRF